MNEAETWAVNVRYQQERDGYNQRQNQKKASSFRISRAVANQQIAADGNYAAQLKRTRVRSSDSKWQTWAQLHTGE